MMVDVAEKSCCDADNERSDERTKATSSYVDLVGLKVFSSVELSRERIGNCYKTRSTCKTDTNEYFTYTRLPIRKTVILS